MGDRYGWSDADAAAIWFGLVYAASGIGIAVRERLTECSAICRGVYTLIALAGIEMSELARELYLPWHGLLELGLPQGLFDLEPTAVALGRPSGDGGVDAVRLCTPILLLDDPSRLSDRGALLHSFNSSTYHLAQRDVVCIRSPPNAPPLRLTAALINATGQTPTYALPPTTEVSLEAVRKPPRIANFRRWHWYEEADGRPRFTDRRDTVFDARANQYRPSIYLQVDAGRGRTRYHIITRGHPRKGELVDAIDYSPEETFDRIVTGCRFLDLTVTQTLPPALNRLPAYAGGETSSEASAATGAPAAAASVRRWHLRWQRLHLRGRKQPHRGTCTAQPLRPAPPSPYAEGLPLRACPRFLPPSQSRGPSCVRRKRQRMRRPRG